VIVCGGATGSVRFGEGGEASARFGQWRQPEMHAKRKEDFRHKYPTEIQVARCDGEHNFAFSLAGLQGSAMLAQMAHRDQFLIRI
jgi:hypothetical protein